VPWVEGRTGSPRLRCSWPLIARRWRGGCGTRRCGPSVSGAGCEAARRSATSHCGSCSRDQPRGGPSWPGGSGLPWCAGSAPLPRERAVRALRSAVRALLGPAADLPQGEPVKRPRIHDPGRSRGVPRDAGAAGVPPGECSHHSTGGSRTASMTWITPLSASMSVAAHLHHFWILTKRRRPSRTHRRSERTRWTGAGRRRPRPGPRRPGRRPGW